MSKRPIIHFVALADDEIIHSSGYKNPVNEIKKIDIAIANAIYEGKLCGDCIYCKASWIVDIANHLSEHQFKEGTTLNQVRRYIINYIKKEYKKEVHPRYVYKKYPQSRDMKNLCISRKWIKPQAVKKKNTKSKKKNS